MAAMAVGEAFPEDALRGIAAHWGCVRHEGAGWEPPPPGWHTLPDASFGAGAHIKRPLRNHGQSGTRVPVRVVLASGSGLAQGRV